jgi:hypothetical protein
MANTPSGSDNTILTSNWMGLNDLLIARLYPVDSEGSRVGQDQIEVHAPLIDSNIEATLNWQSPFESSSPDTKAPALTAMLQSGALLAVSKDLTGDKDGSSAKAGFATKALQDAKGRTGITQLNSVQVFTSMAPIKITVTLLFRAFMDAQSEVDDPLQQLWAWALPQMLSKENIVQRASSVIKSGGATAVEALLPSIAPQMIGFQYKRRTYAPMVIESIGEPLSSPITKDGFYSEIAVPLTLCTLTALDKDDMRRVMTPNASA